MIVPAQSKRIPIMSYQSDMELENKKDIKQAGIQETSYPIEYGEIAPVDGGRVESGLEEEDEDKYATTQRGLKSRHLQMIAIGGAIGMLRLMVVP